MKLMSRLFLLLSMLGVCTFSQAQGLQGRGAPETILPKLYALDGMEIHAGQMGGFKACRKKIQTYADKIAAAHTSHQQAVIDLANQHRADYRNVSWSTAEARIVASMQAKMTELERRARGDDFDSEFLVFMRDGHASAIQLVKASMTSENGPDLRTFLNQTLAAMTSHYKEARQLLVDLEKNGDDDLDDDQDCSGDQDNGDQSLF